MIILFVFPKLEVKRTSNAMVCRANTMQKLHQIERLKDAKVLDVQVKPVLPQSRCVISVLLRFLTSFRMLIIVRISVGDAKLGTNWASFDPDTKKA